MRSLFTRKPIAELLTEGGHPHALKRSLGALDLIALAIGAVIGAGIFGAIGTAVAGEIRIDEAGVAHTVRAAAGPAVVFSFALLGMVCGLAALCYAELASMIPQAGSAYAYAYATLGELVAWIIGWDLILEYAVGNVAVAISWSGYLTPMLAGLGIDIPAWLSRGYYDVLATSHGESAAALAAQELLATAPRLGGVPILVNLPACLVVAAITWLLLLGARESAWANNVMVLIKLVVLALFVIVGAMHVDAANYVPFAPNGWTGVHHGAAIVFFAYIGFDAISTAAEETKNPQRNLPIGILGGLAVCTLIYILVAIVMTGLAPYHELRGVSDPLAFALERAQASDLVRWIVAAGAVVSMSAVLLVFQYGQPRILLAMARDGLLPKRMAAVHRKYRTPWATTILTGVLVGLGALIADDDATYDLTNIGTLFAFFLVCIGVLVLRIVDPARPRPFRVPAVWLVAPLGAAACVWTMAGLPREAWERFLIWLVIGLALYFSYGWRHSVLRARLAGAPPTEPPQSSPPGAGP
jgi:APA family basic amino acid/polyamine antiporter